MPAAVFRDPSPFDFVEDTFDAERLTAPVPAARATPTLDALLSSGAVWRNGATTPRVLAEPSGHAALDALLPSGGWPVGALTELLLDAEGIGELGLVLPWLGRLTQAGGRAAFIDPPHLPFAPALAAAGLVLPRLLVVRPQSIEGGLWALEQALKNAACGAVIGWHGFVSEIRAMPGSTNHLPTSRDLGVAELRRLQLAAHESRTTALLFRPATAAAQPSTAALRLRLSVGSQGGLDIEVLKARGGRPARLELPRAA